MSYTISLALYAARNFYTIHRELAGGKGFADFVFLPKPEYKMDYPAIVVELKWNQNADTAMKQIIDKKYPATIEGYTGDILLVAINYDKDNKEHQCLIQEYEIR